MIGIHRYLGYFAATIGFCLPISTGTAQTGGATPSGREAMWPAPTKEDWKRPVLITFQRNWEDALAVSKETGKPILICVNMDGEIASEHYAGIRYRQPEITTLYEPYVNVIASVYRHSPRDYDENGERILCPRFGSVTCGEHITIEPILYDKFFDGKRIAPRHVMVELDGKESYDIYYAFDTASVFKAIGDGIDKRDITPPAVVRGDRTMVERVASQDIADRKAVEKAYREGNRDLQRSLLESAVEHSEASPTDLLRLAIFGFDTELTKIARSSLAKTESSGAIDLIAHALRVPMETPDREALISALDRLGQSSARARTLSVVHRGLSSQSKKVDVEGWSTAIQGGGSYAAAADWDKLEAELDKTSANAGSEPTDGSRQLELAEASLTFAVDPKTKQMLSSDRKTASKYSRLMFEDARRAALQAEKLGKTGWRVNAVLALTAYYLGDLETAHARAEAAAANIPSGAEEWSAIATLVLFAQARQKAITEAVRKKEQWPGQWLTDVNATYAVLAKHPLGTDLHAAAHYDFLKVLGAGGRASRVLDEGLRRFPDSGTLHDCLRSRSLEERGAAGLESTYEAMLRQEDASPNLEWFAGLASIVAAEFQRRAGKDTEATTAYARAIDHYESSIKIKPDSKEASDHYIALAQAGQARLAYERGDHEQALSKLLACFKRRPQAAASRDGLNISPVDTARMLGARLRRMGHDDLSAQLQAALGELDPEMLRLPAYERWGRSNQTRRRRR